MKGFGCKNYFGNMSWTLQLTQLTPPNIGSEIKKLTSFPKYNGHLPAEWTMGHLFVTHPSDPSLDQSLEMYGRRLRMGLVGPWTYQACRRLRLCKVYSGVSQSGHSEKDARCILYIEGKMQRFWKE